MRPAHRPRPSRTELADLHARRDELEAQRLRLKAQLADVNRDLYRIGLALAAAAEDPR